MKIAINALFIQPNHNYGAATYTLELLGALNKIGKHEYAVIYNKRSERLFEGLDRFDRVVAPVDGGNRVVRILYEQFRLQSLVKQLGCWLLFCPGYLGPIWPKIRTVLTVHDCQFRDIPKLINQNTRRAYELILPPAAHAASHVITISQFSKSRILHNIGIPESRVTVIAEGPPKLSPVVAEERKMELLRKFSIHKPFLLSVSGKGPHKNFQRVKDGFLQFKLETGADYELVVVGHHDEREDASIIYTGFVSHEERDVLYRSASAYIFGSLYEGFGLTLLEALQAGLPVASSNAASLTEVGGNACIWFDPYDVSAIKRAISIVLTDEDVRSRCRRLAPEQCKRFSWEKCALETEAVFSQISELNE